MARHGTGRFSGAGRRAPALVAVASNVSASLAWLTLSSEDARVRHRARHAPRIERRKGCSETIALPLAVLLRFAGDADLPHLVEGRLRDIVLPSPLRRPRPRCSISGIPCRRAAATCSAATASRS